MKQILSFFRNCSDRSFSYRKTYKRFFDISIAVTGILLLSPLLLFIIVLLGFTTNGKPFFFQMRPGLDEMLFTLIKFRTMHEKTDLKGDLLADHLRVSTIGKFLRNTSLDEIPQLWNVLNGDMSLVGPRPLLTDYLAFYTVEQRKRHSVRPGMTGWAQVNGRTKISWEDKFTYDNWYVHHYSFRMDLKILLLTITKLIIWSKPGTPRQVPEKFTRSKHT